MNTKRLLRQFSDIVSPSGYEYMARPAIEKILAENFEDVFDEVAFDKFGGCRLLKKAAENNFPAKKILFDAHIDQIGLVVTEILEGGFLRIATLGGIDLNILPASEFYVYTYEQSEPFVFSADKKILAIAISVPPHLKKTDGSALPKLEDIYLDTGYDSKEELEKIVRVGSPVMFKSDFLCLENELVAFAGQDDRLCAAILLLAAQKAKPAVDICIALSAGEETGGPGAGSAAFDIGPEFAVVLDVGFAKDPGVKTEGSFEMGKGAGISYSAATNIKLTKKIAALAKAKKIPLQTIAEPRGTGTNADTIQITGEGIPCALVSVPIKNMHTASEICSIKDIEKTVRLVGAIMENAEVLL